MVTDHQRKQDDPTAYKCHNLRVWENIYIYSTQKNVTSSPTAHKPHWLTHPRQMPYKWLNTPLLPETTHYAQLLTSQRAFKSVSKHTTPTRLSVIPFPSELILYVRSTIFTKILSYRQHTGPCCSSLCLNMCKCRVSKSSRTSAKSRRGDTHFPLNWKHEQELFWPSHFGKNKVSYLFAGGEAGALVCSGSMSFLQRGETKPARCSLRAACC